MCINEYAKGWPRVPQHLEQHGFLQEAGEGRPAHVLVREVREVAVRPGGGGGGGGGEGGATSGGCPPEPT